MNQPTYVCKPIVRYLRHDEAFTYHGEWELPVRALRLIMPAGENARELIKRLREAVEAFIDCKPCLYVPVEFNGRVEYTDAESEVVTLPSVVRVHGPRLAMLEISLSDELCSQSIFYEIVGGTDQSLAPDIDALDTLLQNRRAENWLQRDVTCMLRRPQNIVFKGGVKGLRIPIQVYVCVSAWDVDGEYVCTPVPSTLVAEGGVDIPEGGFISTHLKEAVDNIAIANSELKEIMDTTISMLQEDLPDKSKLKLSEVGQATVNQLLSKHPHDTSEFLIWNVESKNIGKYIKNNS